LDKGAMEDKEQGWQIFLRKSNLTILRMNGKLTF
jgi:hypothetical protein